MNTNQKKSGTLILISYKAKYNKINKILKIIKGQYIW